MRPTSLRTAGALLAASLVLAACGTSGGTERAESTSTTRPPTTSEATTTTVDHQADLAEGETAGIASQLVEVPGYEYADVSSTEVDGELEILQRDLSVLGDDPVRAADFHSVVADDPSLNTASGSTGPEVGFLRLLEFTTPPPSDLTSTATRLGSSGLDEVDSFDADGVEVVVFEDPSSTNSRWTLMWLRHGVQGVIDGATREPLEDWVRGYLSIPEHEPTEDDQLVDALRPVRGHAYVNTWDDELVAAVELLLAGHPGSIHSVTDDTGAMAVLVLAETGDPLDEQGLLDLLDQLDPSGTATSTEIAGLPVATLTSNGATSWAWSDGDITGILVAPDGAARASFLEPYLASR